MGKGIVLLSQNIQCNLHKFEAATSSEYISEIKQWYVQRDFP